MIPANLTSLANHLWQSTLFAAAAGLLCLTLRSQRAQIRYGLWLAASLKFLVPFTLLVGIGHQFEWRSAVPAAAQSRLPVTIKQISEPFIQFNASKPALKLISTTPRSNLVPAVLLGIWILGFAAVAVPWIVRWRQIRKAIRTASPLPLDVPMRVVSSLARIEPGVFGIFRPVLLLPKGILERLTQEQLRAIVAHEMCHVRRRDNLAAAVHMAVEAMFWFHPLVWWIGSRMVEERERACDEAVLSETAEPQTYAEGILNVCKFYLASPLQCMSGVTGSDLKKRIEEIMSQRIISNLGLGKKLVLTSAAVLALGLPIAIGVLNAPKAHAQAPSAATAPLTFEVASVKPSSGDDPRIGIMIQPGGGLRTTSTTLKFLITFAYDVRDFQISGGPGWINSDRFDITAKSDQDDSPATLEAMRNMSDAQMKSNADKIRLKLQALLAERFQLAIHHATKEDQVYALVVGKTGVKMKESEMAQAQPRRMMRMGRGELNGEGVTTEFIAHALSNQLGRPVIDRTGLTGHYEFKLQWTPDPGQAAMFGGGPPPPGADAPTPPDPNGPSIFTAVQEQLGLRLESQKGPVDMIVIDKVEKLSEN